MKRIMFILAAITVLLTACENTMKEDSVWGVTLHTSMIIDTYHDGDNILDTVIGPYSGAAVVYRKIDTSMIDTVVPISLGVSWESIIHLNNGDTVSPIDIVEYNNGIAYIDGLTLNDYSILRWVYSRKGIICDWIDISVAQHGMDIYDTMTRFGIYY